MKQGRPGDPDIARPGRPAVVARVGADGTIKLFGEDGEPVGFDGEADPLQTAREVAEGLGIELSTWQSYVRRGYAPEADEKELDRPEGARIHRWRSSTIAAWRAQRRWKSKRVPPKGA